MMPANDAQHRAAGVEQIGAQRRGAPVDCYESRCCFSAGWLRLGRCIGPRHRLILRVAGCGTRQPTSCEIARASRCSFENREAAQQSLRAGLPQPEVEQCSRRCLRFARLAGSVCSLAPFASSTSGAAGFPAVRSIDNSCSTVVFRILVMAFDVRGLRMPERSFTAREIIDKECETHGCDCRCECADCADVGITCLRMLFSFHAVRGKTRTACNCRFGCDRILELRVAIIQYVIDVFT